MQASERSALSTPPAEPIEHLVSLNWDHPLPSAVVALTLRPRSMTLVAPKAATTSARQLKEVLEQHGIHVEIRFGENATNLDEGSAGAQMRSVITKALKVSDGVVLDYTGGSKLMAAIARLELEPNGSSRAVYLDVLAGLLRWDDGRQQPASSALDIVELGALHGSGVLGDGGRALSDIEFRDEVLADVARILQRTKAGARRLFWKDVAELADAASGLGKRSTGPDRRADAEKALRALSDDVAEGRAHMLPLSLGLEGDWLEILVAASVERALGDACNGATVRIGVEGRREQTGLRHPGIRSKHPAVRAFLLALRRRSTGEGAPDEIADALDGLLNVGPDQRPPGSLDPDFELDVVVLRGHQVHGLSCYGGIDEEHLAWKSREIARRVVQLGGDFAQPGFVCLLDREPAKELERQLRRSTPGAPSVTVFGLDDLVDWTGDEPMLQRLIDFLGLRPHEELDNRVDLPEELGHDLLATVGGTPLPVLQSILAHGAKRPLLLHTPRTAGEANRISDLLARRGVPATRVQIPSAFRAKVVDSVLRQFPPSERVDITGGTKVLSTRVLLHHTKHASISSATYVDGRESLLRSLDSAVSAKDLPTDLALDEILMLRGWVLDEAVAISPAREVETPSAHPLTALSPVDAVGRLATALAGALGSGGEVFRDVCLGHTTSSRRDRIDLLLRYGPQVAVVGVPLSDVPAEVTRAAWPALLLASDALGDYARVAFVTKLEECRRQRVERQLQRRSAGATLPRVLGLQELEEHSGHGAAVVLGALGFPAPSDGSTS